MKGRFNIDLRKVCESLREQGEKDFKELLTPEQQEKFRKAAEILAQNKIDCEKFKGRDGI